MRRVIWRTKAALVPLARRSFNSPVGWSLSLNFVRLAYGVLATFVLLGTFGSFVVWQKVGDTSSIPITWAAWGVTVVAAASEIYLNVWNVFLRNLDQVLVATRISLIAYGLRLVLACLL